MGDRSRTPPRRGIRGGVSARRKRLAWINYNLEQGAQWDDIPVAFLLLILVGSSVSCTRLQLGSPLTYPSRPLSQSTSEATRLVPSPKGVAKSSSSSSRPAVSASPPAKASQVTISRSNPL